MPTTPESYNLPTRSARADMMPAGPLRDGPQEGDDRARARAAFAAALQAEAEGALRPDAPMAAQNPLSDLLNNRQVQAALAQMGPRDQRAFLQALQQIYDRQAGPAESADTQARRPGL